MAYIGREPQVGNFQVCDAISVVDGQAAYTMQVGSVNVSPETANHMLVSLNGVLQKPGSSFTVSGSTITFASNLVTGDVIDFIHILGSVLDLGVPSDDTVATSSLKANSVTAAKFNADVISGQTALASEPADTDEFLVSDAGVLKRIDYSLIKGGGIIEADMFRLTANITSNTDPISSNLERVDDATFSKIGTGMTNNSGHFSFPSTGLYHVMYNYKMTWSSFDSTNVMLSVSTDSASSYDNVAHVDQPGTEQQQSANHAFVNVTNASTFRVKFHTSSQSSSTITGNTDANYTTFTFIRLGDSQ